MLGTTPDWVQDGGAWLAFVGGFCVIVASCYGFARWAKRGFANEVREIVEDSIGPIRDEVARSAQDLREHMAAEEVSLEKHAKAINAHIDEDRAQFDEIRKWRAEVDTALGVKRGHRNV